MRTALRFAALLGLIVGIFAWRRATKPRLVVCKPWSEDELGEIQASLIEQHLGLDGDEIARRRWAYGSGPGTLAGYDDL